MGGKTLFIKNSIHIFGSSFDDEPSFRCAIEDFFRCISTYKYEFRLLEVGFYNVFPKFFFSWKNGLYNLVRAKITDADKIFSF